VIALARHCIRYRELLSAFIVRELRARYRGSLLGGLWMVLQPVVFLGVYYTVFVKFLAFRMVEGLPADVAASLSPKVRGLLEDPSTHASMSALGMFVALIPWTSIAECTMRATGTVFENGNMIKKIAFPSELLPVYLVGYNLVNVAVGFAVFILAAALFVGLWPDPALLALFPLVLLLQAVFMLGVSYLVSTVTVFVRDVGQLIPILITMWMFFSPIFYFGLPGEAQQYQWILETNPVYHLLAMYRAIFLFQPASLGGFPWTSLAIFSIVAFAVAIAGHWVFVRYKADFADEL
jgi:ABC-type polysaccharide/polyol phosphate export permease